MKVTEESEKVGLKLNIQKTKVMASGSHHFMAYSWGNSDRLHFGGLENHCRRWLQLQNKSLAPWKKSYDKPKAYIKKQRHYSAIKGPSSQGYSFSSSHVWMWELHYKVSWVPNIDAFELWYWRKLLRVPWTVRRSNQSILKEISPEYSLEGLMLQLKCQYFGHLMWRTDWLEKTLMLGKIEGRRRRGLQRMRWLDCITDSMDMSLLTLGVGDGQRGLVCYSSWGHKESNTTEWLNRTKHMYCGNICMCPETHGHI